MTLKEKYSTYSSGFFAGWDAAKRNEEKQQEIDSWNEAFPADPATQSSYKDGLIT